MITITPFEEFYTQDVIDLVLHFQNDGTRPIVTVEDQPDMLHITDAYFRIGGSFWIARDGEKLAGTIGIMPCGNGVAVLKKFFVYEKYQGEPVHLGRQLYAVLLQFAKENGIHTLMLDTPHNTVRAHRFYEKAGFRKVSENELPVRFSHPYADCDFFLLEL